MIFLFILATVFAFADNPVIKWSTTFEIVEKHEFYKNNELITRPRGSWEILFGVIYPDSNLQKKKDCVYFRVPDELPGSLKIKTLSPSEPCESHRYSSGDTTKNDIQGLQFRLTQGSIALIMTLPEYKIEKWEASFLNTFDKSTPKNLISSDEYLHPKMIFLAKTNSPKVVTPTNNLKMCHNISEDCKELSPSSCESCPEGWYEIPNGCKQGPKFCGIQFCGKKNQPACRRGMIYQREKKKYDCRTDSSFAYCTKGFRVNCEGNLAYCI